MWHLEVHGHTFPYSFSLQLSSAPTSQLPRPSAVTKAYISAWLASFAIKASVQTSSSSTLPLKHLTQTLSFLSLTEVVFFFCLFASQRLSLKKTNTSLILYHSIPCGYHTVALLPGSVKGLITCKCNSNLQIIHNGPLELNS